MPSSESQMMEELAGQTEGDLGEIGGAGEAPSSKEDEDNEEDRGTNTKEAKAKKRRIRAASLNAALLLIVRHLPTIQFCS
jgi:hypothetical protein